MSVILRNSRTPKDFMLGTQRARSPAETLAANMRFMPMMGITRLANVTGLDRIGLPVYVAIRPNSRALATSQGKGATMDSAKASALMESIETWHAERIAGPLQYDSYASLRGRCAVVDPHELAIRSDMTFLPDRAISWIEGWDLASDSHIWLPYETVGVNFVRQPSSNPIFLVSTNGLASGNHVIEAIVHGLCEVIERDALTLWTLVPEERRKASQVDLGSISDPTLATLIALLDRKGIALGAWDITTDIGIPTYTCTIAEDPASASWRTYHMFNGHGTHLSPEIALSRAVHEAIQSRLTAISGSRDDLFHADYSRASNPDDHARMLAVIRQTAEMRSFAAAKPPLSDVLEEDLDTIMQRLHRVGIDSVIVADLTRADVGIPVVKVVVPGLECARTPFYRPGPRAQRYQRNLAQ